MNRKNKDIAGFQILNILAEVDGDFDPTEGKVIVEYVSHHFPLGGNLESALEELSTSKAEDYPILLQKCAEDFYADSTDSERLELIDFALKLIKADDKIAKEEDSLLNSLYQYWDLH
jgi:uncharacterized tellurite resistance protein B-like protein